MNPPSDSPKHPADERPQLGADANPRHPLNGVELIDCDDDPTSETEIPADPDRWTLPVIREGAAVALLVCAAPVFAACIAAAGVGTLAALSPV